MKEYQLLILLLLLGVLVVFVLKVKSENLCIMTPYGPVTDVPASNYIDANMAMVHSTSIGQAPLGDPRFWLPSHSPITQGQWGLYSQALPLSETQPFDRSKLIAATQAVPVYSEPALSNVSCKKITHD